MNFSIYKNDFVLLARQNKLTAEQVDSCLEYAKGLADRGLPVIYDARHFCLLVGYKPQYVMGVANDSARYYRHYAIPKKTTGTREIAEPLPSLKEIQRWILDNILSQVSPSPYAKAFRPGYTLADNARFHLRQAKVITIDLENFFPSITFPRVLAQFTNLGYDKPVSVLLAKICCLGDKLPQGAPTSPWLSNLVASRLDRRVASFTIKRGWRYTRYADDLTFSNVDDVSSLLNFLNYCVATEGFTINKKKTRIIKEHSRQLVTGLVVNDRISPPRRTIRKLRQQIFYIEKFGLESHLSRTRDDHRWPLARLVGLFEFVRYYGLNKRLATRWKIFFRHLRKHYISRGGLLYAQPKTAEPKT